MPPKQRIRKHFGSNQDYLLLKQVNTDLPFCAPYGQLTARWEKVAATLNESYAFKMHRLQGPVAKNRFDRLIARYRYWVENGSHPESAPSQDAAFHRIMVEVIPKLEAAEAKPLTPTLGKRGRPRKNHSEKRLPPIMKKLLSVVSQNTIVSCPPSSSPSSLTLVNSKDQVLPVSAESSHQHFTPGDDVLLAKCVKEVLPFCARFGAISRAWENVANKLDKCPEFSKNSVNGPMVRYRFDKLVAKYRERVKRNNGHIVGPEGAPAGELDVYMTELVTLLDGGDPVSAASLAHSVAIATAIVTTVETPQLVDTPMSPNGSSASTISEPSSPISSEFEDVLHATQSSTTSEPSFEPAPMSIKPATLSAALKPSHSTNITEIKALLQEMIEQQIRITEHMMLLQREERRLEAERRERELEIEREERIKDHRALTATVVAAMKMFLLEQRDRQK